MNKQHNLIIVMADQFRADALGIHGNAMVKTPNFDGFVQQSVDAVNYFTNCPVCVPSRVTLFTGRYPHSHRIRENHTLPETGSEMHLFRVLKQSGYRLGYFGKNHLLNIAEFANFDSCDLESGASYPSSSPYNHRYTADEERYRDLERERSSIMERDGAFAGAAGHDFDENLTEPGIFTNSAIRFLEQKQDTPFCMCLSWVAPHAPHLAPEFLREMYRDAPVPNADPELLRDKANRWYVKYRAQRSDKASEADKQNFIATYYAMVTALDRQFGRLMNTLRAQGLEDNTIVVFTSDHGEFLFNNGMCKKDLVLCDHLLHVPLLIRSPHLTPRAVDGMIEEVDVLPTLLDMLGIEPPIGVQGKSALPLLRGETDTHKEAVYSEICAPWQYNPYSTFDEMDSDWQLRHKRPAPLNVPGDFTKSIRTATHRYVWYTSGEEELYNIETDPDENINLAKKPEFATLLRDLKLQLLEWNAISEEPLDPKLCAKNQMRFSNWSCTKASDGADGGPEWINQCKGGKS